MYSAEDRTPERDLCRLRGGGPVPVVRQVLRLPGVSGLRGRGGLETGLDPKDGWEGGGELFGVYARYRDCILPGGSGVYPSPHSLSVESRDPRSVRGRSGPQDHPRGRSGTLCTGPSLSVHKVRVGTWLERVIGSTPAEWLWWALQAKGFATALFLSPVVLTRRTYKPFAPRPASSPQGPYRSGNVGVPRRTPWALDPSVRRPGSTGPSEVFSMWWGRVGESLVEGWGVDPGRVYEGEGVPRGVDRRGSR